ncbi:26S proteasome regulatory subunit 6B [Hypoxylon texense]
MEEAQRKIELQAPDDLSYLLANVRRAAAARLDEAFPPVDGADAAAGDDELRTRIEKLVDEYITKTFTLAIPNLSINGLPIGDPAYYLSGGHGSSGPQQQQQRQPEEVYEPFDARKRARVEELTREEEDLLRDIAQLKKTVPQAAAAAWAESARRSVADDERALAAANDRSVATTAITADSQGQGEEGEKKKKKTKKLVLGDASSWGLERQDDVEDSYTDAVMGLDRLKRETPAVVARMERAKSAGEYVVTER